MRIALGLQIGHEEALATAAVHDLWLVAGQRVYQGDRLRAQRSWIIGASTGHTALILDFAPGTAGFKYNLLARTVVDSEICFFPSAAPLRALIKTLHGGANAPEGAGSEIDW